MGQWHARHVRFVLRDPLENGLLQDLPHARQLRQPARTGGSLELAQCLDAQLLVNELGALGPDARNAQHRHQAFWRLARELSEQGELARPAHPGDLAREVGADSGKLLEGMPIVLQHRLDGRAERADRARRISIGGHTEGICPLNLEEIGSLLERVGDLNVLHGRPFSRVCRPASETRARR